MLSLRFWWPPRSPAESRLGGLRGPLRAAEPEEGRRGWVCTCFPLWAPCSGATALPGGLPCSQPTPGTSLPGPPSHSPSVSGPCISYTAPQSTGCERRAVSRSRLPPEGGQSQPSSHRGAGIQEAPEIPSQGRRRLTLGALRGPTATTGAPAESSGDLGPSPPSTRDSPDWEPLGRGRQAQHPQAPSPNHLSLRGLVRPQAGRTCDCLSRIPSAQGEKGRWAGICDQGPSPTPHSQGLGQVPWPTGQSGRLPGEGGIFEG